ncbi:hypothetical protein Q9295_06450 [Xinfangfangia sp. CPCC 101601]|uniref:Uncharacterized protein n=1 Tax=Pseudogemmobacter lacusdianii TaxID=3069608 RepID=A0ABU0VW82_9RHOB|nr:hypothetical protein [Xinfangfangia sp. CPCC 101601]MDQ2066004.1 hypothetical protein [Xinfangfangia sp. CPCC 101601]
MRLLALILLAVTLPTAVLALDGRVIGLGGTDTVFVWRNADAHSEAMQLIQAGVHQSNPALLLTLLACMVPSGTKAIITDAGFATHDILITSGEQSGCRGNIPMESWD